MNLTTLSTRNAAASTKLFGGIAICLLMPVLLFAGGPSWWTTQGVISTSGTARDYAAANQGQLKNIALKAIEELNANLPGGAGDYLNNSLLPELRRQNANTNDYGALNIGQLKTIAKPFYDRLNEVYYSEQYPWLTAANANRNDYAIANIGQVKNLFAFDISLDEDGNGLPDWWETYYLGCAGETAASDTFRYDGLTVLEAYWGGFFPFDSVDEWGDPLPPQQNFRTTISSPSVVSYKDVKYKVVTLSTLPDFFWTDPTVLCGPVTRTSSNPSIIAPSPYDDRKWISYDAGNATLTMSSTERTITANVSVNRSVWDRKTFIGFSAPGTAAENATNSVDSRIAGKSPSTAKAIFSVRDDMNCIYVRNPNCWAADLDLTCFSPWNSRSYNCFAGALISPRHIILANHAILPIPGDTVRFVTKDNLVITRTYIAVRYCVSDIAIGILDNDVPNTITYAKVLRPASASQLPLRGNSDYLTWPLHIPVLATNQFKEALVKEFVVGESGCSVSPPYSTLRSAFSSSIITGDSGSPVFFIIDNQLVLLTSWTFPSAGPFYRAYYDQINATMAQLSVDAGAQTNYQLSPVDLSGFPAF
jgi:hypothetical protein